MNGAAPTESRGATPSHTAGAARTRGLGSGRARWFGAAALLAALLAWGWFDVRRRGFVDPGNPAAHKTDFLIYTTAGVAFLEGRDGYAIKNIRGWEYLYPPLLALAACPLASLRPEDQVFTWFLLNLLLAAWALIECRRATLAIWNARTSAPRGPPEWIAVAALLAGLFPLLNTLQRGQVGVLLLLLLVLGLRLAVFGPGAVRPLLGGGLLALAIVIKLTPALAVAALLAALFVAACRAPRSSRAARRRLLLVGGGVVAGCAAGFVFVPTALLGWAENWRHLDRWWNAVVANPNLAESTGLVLHSVRNQSLANAMDLFCRGLGLPHLADGLSRAGLGAVMLFLLLVVFRAAGLGGAGLAVASGLALVASLLASPVSWGHHYVLLTPATAFTAAWLARTRGRVALAAIAFSPAALTLAHYAAVERIGGLGTLGIGVWVWFIAATWMCFPPFNAATHPRGGPA